MVGGYVLKNWDMLRNACRPMMKQRVSELREVYDKCGLVDKQDWVTVVDLEHHGVRHHKINYTMQRVLMFVVPAFAVGNLFRLQSTKRNGKINITMSFSFIIIFGW